MRALENREISYLAQRITCKGRYQGEWNNWTETRLYIRTPSGREKESLPLGNWHSLKVNPKIKAFIMSLWLHSSYSLSPRHCRRWWWVLMLNCLLCLSHSKQTLAWGKASAGANRLKSISELTHIHCLGTHFKYAKAQRMPQAQQSQRVSKGARTSQKAPLGSIGHLRLANSDSNHQWPHVANCTHG